MHSESETVRVAIERAIAGMNAEELAWRQEGKWCVAQILEHLSLTYSGTAKGIRGVLQNEAPKIRPSTWKECLSVQVLVGMGYFPRGREAPKQVIPREANPRNPNHPPARVRYGPGTNDEMAGLHIQVVPVHAEDAEELSQTLWGKMMRR